ncbi:hypothetical protein D3C85_1510440 [compost metagenome]
MLDGTAGADQAAEQVRLALTPTLAGLVVYLAVHLGAVQGIEQLAVAWRHFQGGQHATTLIFRQLGRGNFA